MNPPYPTLNGVTFKPGVRVFVTDRDHGNWDYEGTIVAARNPEGRWVFDVQFEYDIFTMDFDQIEPASQNTPEATEEARQWKANRQLRIFLCYGSEDKVSVRELCELLRGADMNPWFDERDIQLGDDWDNTIRTAMLKCQVILVVLSRTSVSKRGYVQREIKLGLEYAKAQPGKVYLIPVKLEEVALPKNLARYQWVNLFESEGHHRLVSRLRRIALEWLGET
jgi:hypothetical protein